MVQEQVAGMLVVRRINWGDDPSIDDFEAMVIERERQSPGNKDPDERRKVFYEFPKGQVEGTETLAETAYRELAEEAGLCCTPLDDPPLLKQWTQTVTINGVKCEKTVSLFLHVLSDEDDFFGESDELANILHWIQSRHLRARARDSNLRPEMIPIIRSGLEKAVELTTPAPPSPKKVHSTPKTKKSSITLEDAVIASPRVDTSKRRNKENGDDLSQKIPQRRRKSKNT